MDESRAFLPWLAVNGAVPDPAVNVALEFNGQRFTIWDHASAPYLLTSGSTTGRVW